MDINRKVLTVEEADKIRKRIYDVNDQINNLKEVIQSDEFNKMYFFQKIPYKFKLHLLLDEQANLVRKINYVL